MDLFAHEPVNLLADDEGGIRYWPGFADGSMADAWFDAMHDGVSWQSVRRKMYDRVVDVPRLMASFRIEDLPPELRLADMLARVQAVVPAPYDVIGLNLYRDGHDSVAMHNDKLHTIAAGQPIALVSLGSARRMVIRARTGSRRSIIFDLDPGSLLAMSHASQKSHEHGIPKTVHSIGPRISVVFRVRAGRAEKY